MKRLILAAVAAVLATPAWAHLNPGEHGSFAAGFSHPMFGTDHVLAMVAVGLWAALIGGRALWALPVAFVGVMALGFLASLIGAPLPFVEPVILASVVALGVLVAIALPVPVWAGAAMVGFFAFFHGHAHGSEIGAATAFAYGSGFALATALLHAVGLGIGVAARRFLTGERGEMLLRVFGGMTAAGGLMLAVAG